MRRNPEAIQRWGDANRVRPKRTRCGEGTVMKLNLKALALSSGIIWGLGLFILTWWMIAFGGSTGESTFIGRVYIGYTISPIGSVIGLVWAFIDGLIGGALFAWLYNMLATRL